MDEGAMEIWMLDLSKHSARTTWTHCEPSAVCLKAPRRMGHAAHAHSLEPPGGLARGVLQAQRVREVLVKAKVRYVLWQALETLFNP